MNGLPALGMAFMNDGDDGGNVALINVSMNILKYNLFHYGNEQSNANTQPMFMVR